MNQSTIRPVITVHDQREAKRYARGCVTVIDDDTAIRAAILSLLEFEGYAANAFPSAVSFLSALVCVRWLLRYISTHSFVPFAWYRIAFGLVVLLTAYRGWVIWQP